MAEPILLVSLLPCASTEKRNEMIKQMHSMADNALKNEPGVSKYFICLKREDDGTSLYAIEEFADMAALQAHAASEVVKQVTQWTAENNTLSTEAQPAAWLLTYLPGGFRFNRSEVTEKTDPHIVFAELDYLSGAVETATPYWKEVVDTGRDDETGTLAYGVLKDLFKTEDKLFTFEIYESVEYLKEAHIPSAAVQNNIKNTGSLRTGLKHTLLKHIGGFLHRP